MNCSTLLRLLRREYAEFRGNRQSDAHEFLCILLECISCETNRVYIADPKEDIKDTKQENIQECSAKSWYESLRNERSIVTDLFAGQHLTYILCSGCNSQRSHFDIFLDLQLHFSNADRPASSRETLEHILQNTFLSEPVSIIYI